MMEMLLHTTIALHLRVRWHYGSEDLPVLLLFVLEPSHVN